MMSCLCLFGPPFATGLHMVECRAGQLVPCARHYHAGDVRWRLMVARLPLHALAYANFSDACYEASYEMHFVTACVANVAIPRRTVACSQTRAH